MSEPRTHYDANDSHGYHMHDVVEPPEFGNGNTPAEELFNMVYKWGRFGVVTDYNAPAFQEKLIECVKHYADRPF